MQPSPSVGVPLTRPPKAQIADDIRTAAETTGVSFEFLLAQAHQESRLNPSVRNERSTATGLFQFTSTTWLEMIRKHGAEHGLESYAKSITRSSDGTLKVKAHREEILALRRDPKISALMAAEYAKDNEKILEKRLGREASNQDLFLAHFLGPAGAIRVLKGGAKSQDGQRDPLLNAAARANPEVFTDKASGRPYSAHALHAQLEERFRRALSEVAKLDNDLRSQVDVAALRPESRPPQEIARVEAPEAASPEVIVAEKPPPPEVVLASAEPPPPEPSLPIPVVESREKPGLPLYAAVLSEPPKLVPDLQQQGAQTVLRRTVSDETVLSMAIPPRESVLSLKIPPRVIPAAPPVEEERRDTPPSFTPHRPTEVLSASVWRGLIDAMEAADKSFSVNSNDTVAEIIPG